MPSGPSCRVAGSNLFGHVELAIFALSVLVGAMPAGAAPPEELLGDGNDGNRSVPVHLHELYYYHSFDEEVRPVDPQADKTDEPVMPFSTRYTCGKCHTYANIRVGWHFNSSQGARPGRPGEPWVWVDRLTRTQVPVSGRDWPGTFKPHQLGLDAWQMIKRFGRHMPGGDYGENYAQDGEGLSRAEISGEFEINCLACHNADHRQDSSEAALQVLRENFRWVAAAGSGLAEVTGLAMSLPANYDIFLPEETGPSNAAAPRVHYDLSRFDSQNRVFFDIVRQPPAERCYFCHSTQVLNDSGKNEWRRDEDVHLKAGLTCSDCHRNGVDHRITRGYEGEAELENKDESVSSLTCAGCHLGEEGGPGGRLGAPRPEHKGLPLVHFQKLSCTACHSGQKPADKAGLVKTARIHALGLHGVHKMEIDQPKIMTPVFVKGHDDKITAARLIWPAYWGRIKDQDVTAIPPELIKQQAADLLKEGVTNEQGPELTEAQITQVLNLLKSDLEQGEPVYLSGGKLFRLKENTLVSSEHAAARPYVWPLAHDVRPAQQSLGAAGCGDCHTTDSAFFFGKVDVDTAVKSMQGQVKYRYELAGENGTYWKLFNASFVFRPWLKLLGFTVGGLLGLILLAYGLAGLKRLLKIIGGDFRP